MPYTGNFVSCKLNWYSNISYDFSVFYRKVKKNFYAGKHKNFSVRVVGKVFSCEVLFGLFLNQPLFYH